jgi:DNA polymerase (family 10)
MTNKEIAQTFQLLSNLMELHDGDPFRIKSYQFVYQTIRNLDVSLVDLPQSELAKIKGIGKSIALQIVELFSTGSLTGLNNLLEITPPGIIKLLKIKGFGPKKIKQLWSELGIETPGELLYAIQENRLLALKGFGQKSQDELHKQILFLLHHENQYLYPELLQEANELLDFFQAIHSTINIELTGDLKRKLPYSKTIEFILNCAPNTQLFVEIPEVSEVALKEDFITATWKGFYKVVFYFSNGVKFGIKWIVHTGSDTFINSLSVDLLAPDTPHFNTVEEVFSFLKLQVIPPEVREYPIHDILDHNVLDNLITIDDIKGVVHSHSLYSDGSNTIAQMASVSQQSGYAYLVMTDHSQAAFYANGLKWDRIIQQQQEIDKLNKDNAGFTILKGIECDILSNGDLDYNHEILSTFDVIIASVHSILKMDEERAMSRIIKAIENPFTHILGHPTGRLLLSRPGYPLDMKKVIDACSANKVAIELNANPRRLDIDWQWIPYAMHKNVFISINPDAHAIKGIQDIKYGVDMARKGKLQKELCLNACDVLTFLERIKK